jgi:4'-phosphopantetheinyl transferase
VDRELGKERTGGEPGQQRVATDAIFPLAWPVSRIPGTIAPEEVHLWAWVFPPATADLGIADLAAHTEVLDHQERERMQRFHFAPDRERYAVAHTNLRRILGAYLNQSPEKVCFRANRFGKPELAGEASLNFNLSHCRSIAVLAVAHGQPVGVDVEDVKPVEPEVADMHFSATELSHLNRLQGDAWLSGFYRCWTRKEAILKAEGVGLSRALDSFDVELLPDKPPQLVGTRERFSHPWTLHDLSPSPGTIGALATAQTQIRLAYFSL